MHIHARTCTNSPLLCSPHPERHLVVLIEEHVQLRDADAQVSVGELVGDVEAQRPELASLQHHAVEQAQRE